MTLPSHSTYQYLQSPQPPQYIYWQRNDRMVNYDDNRRDVSIETIPGPRTQSRLIIKEPQISDSGNYTCRASNTEPASIYVYVSKGKKGFKPKIKFRNFPTWNNGFVYCCRDETSERFPFDELLIKNNFHQNKRMGKLKIRENVFDRTEFPYQRPNIHLLKFPI